MLCVGLLVEQNHFLHHRKEQVVVYILMPTSFGSVHCRSYFNLKINTIAKKLHWSLFSTRPLHYRTCKPIEPLHQKKEHVKIYVFS